MTDTMTIVIITNISRIKSSSIYSDPVKIKNPNPKYAQIIVSQLGGADCK